MYKSGRLKTLVYRMTKRWDASTRSLYSWMFIGRLMLILHVLSLLLSSVRWSEHTLFLFLLWFSLDSVAPWLVCSTWASLGTCKTAPQNSCGRPSLLSANPLHIWFNRTPPPLRKPHLKDDGDMDSETLDKGCNSVLRTLVCSSCSVSAEWIHFATIILTQIW